MRYDKEQIYDDQISPLMNQIIKICKENEIQMLASFHLREEIGDPDQDDKPSEDKDLACSTYLQFDKVSTSEKIREAYGVIYRKPFFMSMMITSPR